MARIRRPRADVPATLALNGGVIRHWVPIGALILWSVWGIARETADILLEGAPRNLDMGALVRDLLRVDGVRSVHDLHVWSISLNLRALSAHVLTADVSTSQGAAIQRDINRVLVDACTIAHAALPLECEGCESDDVYCEFGMNDAPAAREKERGWRFLYLG